MPRRLPKHLWPLLWDSTPQRVDVTRDVDYLMARVLEFGTLRDVAWLLRRYGPRAVHRFLRDSAHPELSRRTVQFWRSYFRAKDETWRKPPAFRNSSTASWLG